MQEVLDIESYYYMVTEVMNCTRCNKKVLGWSSIVLDQLDIGHRVLFPAILTSKLVNRLFYVDSDSEMFIFNTSMNNYI